MINGLNPTCEIDLITLKKEKKSNTVPVGRIVSIIYGAEGVI